MRLVIDLQGAQTGSRFRGIGRYSLAIAQAIAKHRDSDDEVIIALNAMLPEGIEYIQAQLGGVILPEQIKFWYGVSPTASADTNNAWRNAASERMRDAFIADLRPDCVFITSLFEGLGDNAIVSTSSVGRGIPTAVLLHDLIPYVSPDEHFRTNGGHRRWYRGRIRALRQSTLLLAVSESSRAEALKTRLFADSQIVVIGGASDERFRRVEYSEGERIRIMRRVGISRPFVLYTGAADERKNLFRLIAAYAQLPLSIRERHQIVFAGKMPEAESERLRDAAFAAGLSLDALVLTGYISDDVLVALYNMCSVFAFPSTHEGFGLPVLEAMSCGAPVIGANATSLPEVIGFPGALFDPLSIPDMRDKIQRCLIDDQFRAGLIAHAGTQSARFTWERAAVTALNSLRIIASPSVAKPRHNMIFRSTAIFKRRTIRILALKLDHFGDFLLAIPAFSKLRARFPYATISVVVGSWNRDLAESLRLFDDIIVFDFFRKSSSAPPGSEDRSVDALVGRLGHFDIALDLRRQADTRFLLIRVNADLKVAFETLNELIDSDLDGTVVAYPDAPFISSPLNRTPISRQMLDIVDAIPRDVNDFVSFPNLSDRNHVESRRIAVFPCAGSSVREWPKENFVSLLQILAETELVAEIDVFFRDDAENKSIVLPVDPKIHAHVGLKFEDLCAALSKSTMCIANNSGGAHLASYLGVPVIGIYSGHELTSEWGPAFFHGMALHSEVPCAPCHGAKPADCGRQFQCLANIPVSAVYDRIVEVLTLSSQGDGKTASSLMAKAREILTPEELVSETVQSIAGIPGATENDVVAAAIAIAKNHPTFRVREESVIRVNETVLHSSTRVEWQNFSTDESEFRWTEGSRAAIAFDCASGTSPACNLHLRFDTLGPQRLILSLNGHQIVADDFYGSEINLEIPVSNLEPGMNILEFLLPHARRPGNGDGRLLGMAVREFRLQSRGDGGQFGSQDRAPYAVGPNSS